MTFQRAGIRTIPGMLTHYLDEFELTRSEISQLLGVSVRTIHNIEHGRKPIARETLDRLSAILNDHAQRIQGRAEAVPLTADHFCSSPESMVQVFMQSIVLNRPDLLFVGEDPIASRDFRWIAPGRPARVPFAGTYAGMDIQLLLARLHQTVRHEGVEGVQVLQIPNQSRVIVRAVSRFRHPETDNLFLFKAFVEIDVKGNKLGVIDSTYDSLLLEEFLISGVAPRQRKSDS